MSWSRLFSLAPNCRPDPVVAVVMTASKLQIKRLCRRTGLLGLLLGSGEGLELNRKIYSIYLGSEGHESLRDLRN